MAYEKQNFTDGQVLTAQQLDHMEEGIAAAMEAAENADGSGVDGTTFYPSVSADGVISWTNDGGKQNPDPVDLVAAVIAALPVYNGEVEAV